MDREARIKLIAEGASRAAGDIRGVNSALDGVGRTAQSVGGMFANIGKAAFHAASDAARAMNDVKPINFAASADSAKRFEDVVTRLAVRSNRDIGQLKQQFRDTGKEIGVLPDRVANAARALTKMTGSNQAADALADLGHEANDTDRSLEEMVEIGGELYNKLGVPLERVGEAFKRVRAVAADFRTVGGPTALEDSLVRLAPLLARIQGSVTSATATVAVLGQGKNKDVADRTTATILGALTHADPLLVTKLTRQMTGNAKYNPYQISAETGEAQLKFEAIEMMQKRLRSVPFGAALRVMGNDVTATETIRTADLSLIRKNEARINQTRALLQGDGAVDLNNLQPSDRQTIQELNDQVLGNRARKSQYEDTRAGQRTQTDVERAAVEAEAGEVIQGQRDARNAMYKGQRRQQAGIDTAKQYLGPTVERALDIAEAAAADQAQRGLRPAPGSRADKLTVELGASSIKGIGDEIRKNPPTIAPPISPGAKAVEDSKAVNRGAANF